jgi:tRNA (guanosine-2'-O-)-methyltransferase
MNEKRLKILKETAHHRQGNLTVIIENIVDPHNVGAVMRSCDSVGIHEMFLLFTENSLGQEDFTIGKRASAGSRKWVDLHVYTDAESCFEHVKSRYSKVLSTHFGEDSVSLYDLDLTESVALMFGNEKDGLSKEALSYSDGNFLIPMMGMTQSLNLSVACAVTLFEAQRQRLKKNMYAESNPWPIEKREALLKNYLQRKHKVYGDGRNHTYRIDLET